MANTPLDRLKAQLLTSGIQQDNIALFQVINQLIDYLRLNANAVQAVSGASGSGGLASSFLTKNKELGLPNSLQVLPGAGIQFNDTGGRRIISAAIPFGMDGETGEEGIPGPPGRIGIDGIQGKDGIAMIAIDGEDGVDGDPGQAGATGGAGPTGAAGAPGIPGIDGLDGDIGEDGIPGNIGNTGVTGATGGIGAPGIPGLDGIDGEEIESMIPGPQGPQGLTGGNSGVIFWFDPTDASDIAGYKKALKNPSANAEATNVQVCAGVGDNLLYKFVTEPGVPGVYTIPPGAAFRHIHGAVTTAGGFARYLVETYYCNADGTGETLVGSSYSDPTTDTAIDEVNWDLYKLTTVNILPTQRLVWKLYVARVSGPANVSVTTYFEGLVHPSYVESTISGGATGPPGPMGMQGSSGIYVPMYEPEEPEHPFIIPGPTGSSGSDWTVTVTKVADDAVNNSTVLTADSELFYTSLATSSVYIMEYCLIYSGNNATGDFKWNWRLGGNVADISGFIGFDLHNNSALGAALTARPSVINGNYTYYPTVNGFQSGTDAADTKLVIWGRINLTTPAAFAAESAIRFYFALFAAAAGRIVTVYKGSYFRLKKIF